MDRTPVPKCGLKSCKHLCVRLAKDAYECLCPQGYYMDGGQCKGNVLVAAEVGRRIGEIILVDPKRIKDNIRVRLLVDEQGAIRHLEVDPVKGYIFWSRGCIKRANYDGTNISCIVNVTTYQFVLDTVKSRLCYLEEAGDIHCVDYDGSNNQIVATFPVVDAVQSEMMIGKEKLYLLSGLYEFAVFPDLVPSACAQNNGGCEHLCVSNPDANPSFISYSYGGIIDFVSVSPNTTVPRKTLRYPDIPRGITAVESDADRNQLILIDRSSNRIIVYRFTNNDWYSVADEVGEVEGISLDATNRELYYTRSTPPSIWRLSMSADDPASYPVIPTRVAFLGQGNKPRDIAVHPCRMLIFFTNSGTVPSIERMYYSGYKRERIVEDEIIGESRISIDFSAEKLYFAEITSAKIYRMDFDGKNKELVIPGAQNRTTNTRRPFALALYNDWLIYGNIGSYVSTLELSIADKIDGLGGSDLCASLKCSDECRLTARGEPHCACRGERKLQPDNVTCTGNEYATKNCAENEFLCKLDEKCIPYEETCDRYPDCPHAEDEDVDMCSKLGILQGIQLCK
ncbi:unnamed protein product [Cylicostephanus goldi]|uniref:EGF-like domain-containing protein n=1 Tax=Cylicostephanus goldi TaxID=71465 RepID=A0A3P7MCP6_CYLGO|nr:unnamed protein product [Cylicostephanus goldi]